MTIAVRWLNFEFSPFLAQCQMMMAVLFFHTSAGQAFLPSKIVMASLVIFGVSSFAWGTATSVRPDLEEMAYATGLHLLDKADEITTGDEAFAQLLRLAFAYAGDNSLGNDPIMANKAAILALGVIMGDDAVAKVGRFELDPERKKQRDELRGRITMHGRNDLIRHFAVSGGLTVLSDSTRALAVGIAKEIADSAPGGSGFSFVDMAANKYGIHLANLATRDAETARLVQKMISESKQLGFPLPSIEGLPEGLTTKEFQTEFGGVGGSRTRELFAEIDRRVSECFGELPK